MTDQLITFETAKLAKEKGFEERCRDFFDKDGNAAEPTTKQVAYYRPTQNLLQRWLREKYKYDITIEPFENGRYDYVLYHNSFEGREELNDNYTSFEEALEAALIETLTLI